MIVTFRGFEYLPTQRAGALVLIKAAKYDRTQVRKDEKGRSWVFNNETNRWRVQRDGQDAPAAKTKKEAPPVESKPKSSTSGLTRRIGSALKNGPAHIDALHQHLSKRSPIDKADLAAHIQGLVKRGKLFDHGDGKFGREPGASPAPLKAKTNKQQPQPQQPRQKPEPQQPQEELKTAKPAAKGPVPTFKATEYNPHAIKDLSTHDFVEYRQGVESLAFFNAPDAAWNLPYDKWATQHEGRKKTRAEYAGQIRNAIRMGHPVSPDALQAIKPKKSEQEQNESNRISWDKKKTRMEAIKKAIAHPLMSDEETKGYKPLMSREEADEYTAGSFTGSLKFYHGNDNEVTQSIANDGVNADLNNRGIFGKGFYMAASKDEASYYALSATNPEKTEVISMQCKVKNPYIATADDLGRLGQWFPGDQSNNSDSESVTNYLRAKGHDSIYLADYGYFIAFEGKQVASHKVEKFEGDLRSSAEKKQKHSLEKGWESTVDYAKSSKTGAAMVKLSRSPAIQKPSDEELELL